MLTLTNLAQRLNSQTTTALPPLLLMTDTERLPDPRDILEKLPHGCGVILRHSSHDRLVRLIEDTTEICKRRRLLRLISGDARLALTYRTEGLHLPESLIFNTDQRWQKFRRPHWTITAAVHSQKALFQAQKIGVNAVLLSPIFPTASHPQVATLGIIRFTLWSRKTSLPVYALGGITLSKTQRVQKSNITGIAGIDIFTGL